jgi:peptidoglycan/xylan/chitin deacetylase (PgdA/CDA1 family)
MNKLLFKMIRYSVLPFLFREIIQRSRVTILMFHDIGPEAAEQALAYLTKKYNVIGLEDFIARKPLPPKALILTFDDGHVGNYALLPVFKKYKLPVTIFLCSGIAGTKRHYWFRFRHPEISTGELKKLPSGERLAALGAVGFFQEKEFEEPQTLSKAQIEEMKNAVNFQAHTMFHPCLPKCTDEEARDEIFQCKEVLEKDFGLRVNAFAYPNGDYCDRDAALLKEAGYDCGVTVDFGFNTLTTDPFRLKRLSVNDTSNLDELIVKSSGVWAFFKMKIFKN